MFAHKSVSGLAPRVSLLPALPLSLRKGGKMRDPGSEVGVFLVREGWVGGVLSYLFERFHQMKKPQDSSCTR